MKRLVDYFAVVGYDFEKENLDPALRGKVYVRIPETDWDDMRFTAGIELFCQPAGWYMSKEKIPPTFFVSVLTNEEGNQQFCAVHTFSEPIQATSPLHTPQNHKKENVAVPHDVSNCISSKSEFSHGDDYIDEEMCRVENREIFENSDIDDSKMQFKYAPKCLVLLSRVQDFKILKNCLGLIYTVYIENFTLSIENIIAKLLLIKVPPPGSTQIRFSIGASDKQALQIPQSNQLPITRSCVTVLLQQLGILNVLNILCAALVDQKLLFYSCSYVRLTEACNALTALMYPFKYSYPYIPILPQHLLECTSSPTPFLVGVHSSFKNNLTDLLDVITVDLDGGVISVPECVVLPIIPEPYYSSVVESLTKVLCPDLIVADWAYPPKQMQSSDPEWLDKEIRAIFLRLFSQLLMGYRSCLQICRIHPEVIIRFKKEQYLIMRGFDVSSTYSSNEFVPKLLNSQAFSLFVQENGPPYRYLHKFDEVVAEAPKRIHVDVSDVQEALKYNKKIASDLHNNENPNHMSLVEKIPQPSPGTYERTTQRKFPKLSATAVLAFMEKDRTAIEKTSHTKHLSPSKKHVPEGSLANQVQGPVTTSRRLEVLKDCLLFIFESRTLEIKKIFQAVIRAMKNQAIRNALLHELHSYSTKQPTLDHQQFEYVSRLVNSALQESSGQVDEFFFASNLLPVVTSFIRKLSPTVTQFLYSDVQDHPVWWSNSFWETAFFDDIQEQILSLYKPNLKKKFSNLDSQIPSCNDVIGKKNNGECMDIAAAELEQWDYKSKEEQAEVSRLEEGVVYSQVKHYVQRMLCMLVPFDCSRSTSIKTFSYGQPEENSNSFITGSWHESSNGSMEDLSRADVDVRSLVSGFIAKFVDRVCTEACISNNFTKELVQRVPTMVCMQMDSLEDALKESSRLPPVIKPKILEPKLLTGELFVLERPLRVYLAFDGRETAMGGKIGGPALLPAEGALFLTTYRVIFIGVPCDALASEQVVIRSFPVSSLIKEKSFKVWDFPHVSGIDKGLQDGVEIRSTTFQLLVLAFDVEVVSKEQENFYKHLQFLRYPSSIEGSFAVSSSSSSFVKKSLESTREHSSVEKPSAAKLIYRQAKRKAGIDKPNRLSRLIATGAKSKTLYHSLSNPVSLPSSAHDSASLPDETLTRTLSEKETGDSLFKRSCVADYKRMGLISDETSKFRLSRVNKLFSVCRNYPACVVVPMATTDDQIKSLAHCHQQSTFPASVWIHPDTKSVLFRSGSIRSRTANSLFKHGQQKLSDEGVVGSSSEEENFLSKVASLVPSARLTSGSFSLGSASSQPNSEDEAFSLSSATPRGSTVSLNVAARPPIDPRKWSTLTRSNGKMAVNPRVLTKSFSSGLKSDTMSQIALKHTKTLPTRFYVLVDKEHSRNLRNDPQNLVVFVPTNLADPKHIRNSFKAFLKSCLPASPPPPPPVENASEKLQDTISTYLKDVQDSLWLEQISKLLQAAGSVVDIMDIHGASVMVSFDDASDIVPQLSSLSQLLMDPYYRTISGFRTLIKKEWLSFGHRFSHRNRFSNIQSSAVTPVFFMFLDAVYQILHQLPMSFEFNEFFLETIAFHSFSNRFTTFLLDSDFERLDAGILFEKSLKSESTSRLDSSLSSSEETDTVPPIKSLWEYIDAAHSRAPAFFNPLYCPAYLPNQILRPVHTMSRLKVWPYYIREALGEGPAYDGLLGELTTSSGHSEHEATEDIENSGRTAGRLVVNRCYDNVEEAQPNSIKMLLGKVEALQRELKQPVDDWNTRWRDISVCPPFQLIIARTRTVCDRQNVNDELLQRQLPPSVEVARSEIQSFHRFSTAAMIEKEPPPCDRSDIAETSSHGSFENLSSAATLDSPRLSPSVFRTSSVEVRTYEGSLWKQGALVRGWKVRFFVLDITKHELRQYDNKYDLALKSIIDLKDLDAVSRIENVSNPPKEANRNAYFEVRVSKRLYHFIAESEKAADEWVDYLQSALQ